jgi:hypothetical protein
MVINDFKIFDTSICPPEANAPLPVYTNAVLSSAIAIERF